MEDKNIKSNFGTNHWFQRIARDRIKYKKLNVERVWNDQGGLKYVRKMSKICKKFKIKQCRFQSDVDQLRRFTLNTLLKARWTKVICCPSIHWTLYQKNYTCYFRANVFHDSYVYIWYMVYYIDSWNYCFRIYFYQFLFFEYHIQMSLFCMSIYMQMHIFIRPGRVAKLEVNLGENCQKPLIFNKAFQPHFTSSLIKKKGKYLSRKIFRLSLS